MFQEFKELLSALNVQKVKYLIIGGYAVSYHAQPRATKDLDIFIKPDLENAEALCVALKKFGAPLFGLKAKDLLEPGTFFRVGKPPYMIDILPEVSGVDFNKAWRKRVAKTIDSKKKLKTFFISSDDLITSKLAAGRPQDIADVIALREAKPVKMKRKSSSKLKKRS